MCYPTISLYVLYIYVFIGDELGQSISNSHRSEWCEYD